MTFDPAKILESKRALHRDLAARPIAEKLALLDALRVRQLAIRPAGQSATAESAGILHEEPAPYRAGCFDGFMPEANCKLAETVFAKD
jgi:hypothetical protein